MTFPLNRRDVLAGAIAASAASWTSSAIADSSVGPFALGPAEPFSFDMLKERAKALSTKQYVPPLQPSDSDHLRGMTFDTFAQAVFKPEMELWRDVPGAQKVRLFPQGRYYAEPVAISVLENGQSRLIEYSPDFFKMPDNHPLRKLKTAGFAGFRLMSRGGVSDWLAYLGASYFRASDPNDQYGASARGLAINTGRPEEFPRFTAFWLEQNGSGLTIYALLESQSVTGAYRMDSRRVQGGQAGAVQDVECELYFRAPVDLLGIAPLTGMFWYGENSGHFRGDWRPEVHDCDGLQLWTGRGERIWRPLVNPPRIVTNSFSDENPKGFGLIQRDRDFENYQDDSLFYDRRPSIWVEPAPGWGKGAVNLVQLPSQNETEDNMVAFWTPEKPVVAGSVINARYRMYWGVEAPPAGDVARVVATRVGLGGLGGRDLDLRHTKPGARKFMIDLEGKALEDLTRFDGTRTAVTTSRGTISGVEAFPVVGTNRWRMMFDLSDLDGQPADLRAYLEKNNTQLSETWIYEVFP
ncbi:glucan biosynthesis protein D [Hyphomicrobium methylovorum]|uniref:glucan biosynthesis protein n=1 Tax=Hyphomicrobium methylovorum TaxID=84 RepID=UPI0015E691C9|nr:glucan biosynthesis protein [Hyphomicrobium methylovorum]MBA2125031.1 glucan biosynthesis protein D [Hyphomicrobium methylovorum]